MLNVKDVLILQFLKFTNKSIYTERTQTLLAHRITFWNHTDEIVLINFQCYGS